MYHYANKPGRAAQRVRQIINEAFNTSINGLPGNDDSGAMGSYVVFYLAGLYPLPATRQVLLSSPYFPSVSFHNPVFGTTTTIKSINFGKKNIYVKSTKVHGKPYKSNCYLEWDVFEQGGIVELELTDNVNVTCGSGSEALPPSISTGGYL